MKNPSPVTHLYRLAMVGVAALVVFLALVAIFSPASWHYDMSYWHRADSLEDMKQQPLIYGGIESISASKRNVACKECHKDTVKTVRKLKHKKLSCESCHGPLRDHVAESKKIAEAPIDKTKGACLICHDAHINKPESFPVFRTAEKYLKHREFIAGKLPAGTTCLKCHDAHDPTP